MFLSEWVAVAAAGVSFKAIQTGRQWFVEGTGGVGLKMNSEYAKSVVCSYLLYVELVRDLKFKFNVELHHPTFPPIRLPDYTRPYC